MYESCDHIAYLSMGFSRQQYWSGLPFPSPGDLPNPEIELRSLHCRQILYGLSYEGSPVYGTFIWVRIVLEAVNITSVHCITLAR